MDVSREIPHVTTKPNCYDLLLLCSLLLLFIILVCSFVYIICYCYYYCLDYCLDYYYHYCYLTNLVVRTLRSTGSVLWTTPRRNSSQSLSWSRTNGVNTNGAAAKVMNFDRSGKKGTPWHFWEDKRRLKGVHQKSLCQSTPKLRSDLMSADPILSLSG